MPPTHPPCTVPLPSECGASSPQHATTTETPSSSDNGIQEEDQAHNTAHDASPEPNPIAIAARPSKGQSKDPNRPKQPPSAYFIYQTEVRQTVKLACPTLSPTELPKEIAVMWRALPDEERQRYKDCAKIQKDRWSAELKAYRKGAKARISTPLSGFRAGEPSSKRHRAGSSPYEPTTEPETIEID